MNQDIYNILDKKGKEYNIPNYVWYPIVMSESSGDPTARTLTDREDSRGLFQVNIYSQTDADKSRLYDPEYNADFQMRELSIYTKKAFDSGLSGLDVTKYVEKYGQRPQWSTTLENNLTKYYNDLTGSKVTFLNTSSEDNLNFPDINSKEMQDLYKKAQEHPEEITPEEEEKIKQSMAKTILDAGAATAHTMTGWVGELLNLIKSYGFLLLLYIVLIILFVISVKKIFEKG